MADEKDHDYGFGTRAIHAGAVPDPVTGARATPIHQTTSFVFDSAEHAASLFNLQTFGNVYSRISNPTVAVLEERVASLEGGRAALACATGMAAQMTAILAILKAGDHIVAASTLYGGTVGQLGIGFSRLGIETTFVDPEDPDNFRRAIRPNTRALYGETLGNPLVNVFDIEAVAKIAHAEGLPLVIDNTVASPYLCNPFAFGADIIVHSATKYLGGHGDLTAGVVVAGPPYDGALEGVRKLVGGTLGTFEAWLAHRGVKTLPLRMARQCENAREISARLASHKRVAKVHHPALEDHPDREVARRLLSDTGGLVSFELAAGGREAAFAFLNALELCVRAPSLGDIYTLAIHPATSSHRELSSSRRERLGVRENLIRLSCGIEHPEDVISDLEQALG
jgi:O-acetylhomoserine (thiol)-lyase